MPIDINPSLSGSQDKRKILLVRLDEEISRIYLIHLELDNLWNFLLTFMIPNLSDSVGKKCADILMR